MGDVCWSLDKWCYHSDIMGMDKIMETLDNTGIKLLVLAALKEH
jgi:hypothetical protein